MSSLPTIFTTCKPRQEALQGELPDSIFAADLWDVVSRRDGTHPDYADPVRFFAGTYPTESLKFIVKEVAERLAGVEGGTPVFRFETGFGGGKTHSLIACVHAAREGARLTEALKDYNVTRFPNPDEVKIAAFVGDESDPLGGKRLDIEGEKIKVYTPWGQIAALAGGKRGYELVRDNDVAGVTPDRTVLEEALGDGPVLILIDELVLYMARVSALPADHKRRELGSQYATFLQTLFGIAARRPRTVAIVTLPSEQDANRAMVTQLKANLTAINSASDEAARAAARHARSITPTQANERAAVLGRRLFEFIDTRKAKEVADAYQRYYEQQKQKGVEMDSRAMSADYHQAMVTGYPFHPEFIRLFTERLADIPEFQNTRGALRLVARTIKSVWDRRNELKDSWLFQPQHMDLGRAEMRDEILARLGRSPFERALEADVVTPGGISHSRMVDQELPWPAASEGALVCFLHSLPDGSKGLTPAEVALAIGRPGLDLDYVPKALERSEKKGWYMRREGDNYFFRTRASVRKRFQERLDEVMPNDIRETLDTWTKDVYSGFEAFQVIPFPADHVAIPDNPNKLRLAIIHYDREVGYIGGGDRLNLTKEIFLKTGVNETPRIYKNSLLFLLAEGSRIKGLKDAVSALLAWQRVRSDIETEQRIIAEEQGGDYQTMRKRAQRGEAGVSADFLALQSDLEEVMQEYGPQEVNVRSKLLEAYRVLAFPQGAGNNEFDLFGGGTGNVLECFRIDFGEVPESGKKSAHAAVAEAPLLQCLRQHQKLAQEPTPDQPLILAPALIKKNPIWKEGERRLANKEVWDRLRREPDLPYILREKDLLPTLRAGLTDGPDPLWFYYDQSEKRVYTRENSGILAPAIRDDHFLYDPAEAARDRVLPVKTLSAIEIWDYLWPKENNEPVQKVSSARLMEAAKRSTQFPVLPDRPVLWNGLAEGVRESRWVLYLRGVGLAIGPQEMDEWPGSPRIDEDTEFWSYQAALDGGLYPRPKAENGKDQEDLTPASFKAKCWPNGNDRAAAEDLLRYGRPVWPTLSAPKLENILRQGVREGLWNAWSNGSEETYYTREDSPGPLITISPEWTLVAPGTQLDRDLDSLRPGRGPQSVVKTGTPHEALIQVGEELGQYRGVEVSQLSLTVMNREGLDNTLAATWADRPASAAARVTLMAGGERESEKGLERFSVSYEGHFEEIRSLMAPFWSFNKPGSYFSLMVEVTMTFDPPLALEDPVLMTYRMALMNANQGQLQVKVVPVRRKKVVKV